MSSKADVCVGLSSISSTSDSSTTSAAWCSVSSSFSSQTEEVSDDESLDVSEDDESDDEDEESDDDEDEDPEEFEDDVLDDLLDAEEPEEVDAQDNLRSLILKRRWSCVFMRRVFECIGVQEFSQWIGKISQGIKHVLQRICVKALNSVLFFSVFQQENRRHDHHRVFVHDVFVTVNVDFHKHNSIRVRSGERLENGCKFLARPAPRSVKINNHTVLFQNVLVVVGELYKIQAHLYTWFVGQSSMANQCPIVKTNVLPIRRAAKTRSIFLRRGQGRDFGPGSGRIDGETWRGSCSWSWVGWIAWPVCVSRWGTKRHPGRKTQKGPQTQHFQEAQNAEQDARGFSKSRRETQEKHVS